MRNNRKRILTLLKVSNGLTAGELGGKLDASATAVRRHLKALEEQGRVAHTQEQRGVGRPSYVYRLKNDVPNQFSQSYDAFVRSVLEEAGQVQGPEKLPELLRQRQENRYEPIIPDDSGATLEERVAVLARLLEQDGRLTSWQQVKGGRYVLRQHNCPLRQIAADFSLACNGELSLLQEVLKTEVHRLEHIAEGGVACVYEILDRPSSCPTDSPRCQGSMEHARRFGALPEPASGTRYRVAAD